MRISNQNFNFFDLNRIVFQLEKLVSLFFEVQRKLFSLNFRWPRLEHNERTYFVSTIHQFVKTSWRITPGTPWLDTKKAKCFSRNIFTKNIFTKAAYWEEWSFCLKGMSTVFLRPLAFDYWLLHNGKKCLQNFCKGTKNLEKIFNSFRDISENYVF